MQVIIDDLLNYWKRFLPNYIKPGTILFRFIGIVCEWATLNSWSFFQTVANEMTIYGLTNTRQFVNLEAFGKSLASRRVDLMSNYCAIIASPQGKTGSISSLRFCVNSHLLGLPLTGSQIAFEKEGDEIKVFSQTSTSRTQSNTVRFIEGSLFDPLLLMNKNELISTAAPIINNDNEGTAVILYNEDELISDVALTVLSRWTLFSLPPFQLFPFPSKTAAEQIVSARVHLSFGLNHEVIHSLT